jgi:hypothetical protein
VCALLEPGKNADTGGNTSAVFPENTVGCRKYHAYSALADPEFHCPHAGPTSDGYCGEDGICESYCTILQNSCPSAFADHFGGDAAACRAECAHLQGSDEEDELHYTVTAADSTLLGKTAACRTARAVRALEQVDDATLCAAAIGGAPCD